MKTIFLFVMYLFCCVYVYAQDNFRIYDLPPTSIFPTPDVAQLIQYVDYPVSYCTGIPEISIPLYTLKTREFTFPLSLSYYAAGIRVNDISGCVGLGWNLNAGGVITRVVNGLPDENKSCSVKDEKDIRKEKNVSYLKAVLNSNIDANYDRYYYSFPGQNGSFIYDPNTGKITQIPLTDNLIVVVSHTVNGKTENDFKIVTPDGTSYFFTEKEYIFQMSESSNPTNLDRDICYNAVSSWHLSKIVSFNHTDSIELTYQNIGGWVKENVKRIYSQTVVCSNESSNENVSGRNPQMVHNMLYTTFRYNNCRLVSSVKGNGARIFFDYTDDRTDKGFKARLSGLRIYSDTLISCIKFENQNSYFPDGRLRLTGVEFFGKNGLKTDSYIFSYISTYTEHNEYAQDFFGYCNGKNNKDLYFIDAGGNKTNTRDPDPNYTANYTLGRIQNMAGATTQFVYEPNSYCDPKIGNIFIGIRVKSIETKGLNLSKIREFKYGKSFTSIDFGLLDKACFWIQSGTTTQLKSGTTGTVSQSNLYFDHSIMPGIIPENARIYYGNVSEIIWGAQDGTTRVDYEYDTTCFVNPFIVTAYTPALTHLFMGLGHSLYCRQISMDDDFVFHPFPGYFCENDWAYGNLVRETTYKYQDSVFLPVRIVTNRYVNYDTRQIQVGTYVQGALYTYYDRGLNGYFQKYESPDDFYFFNVFVGTGCRKLVSTTIDKIFASGNISERYNYNYVSHSDLHTDTIHPYPPDYPIVVPSSLNGNLRGNGLLKSFSYRSGTKVSVENYYYPEDFTQAPYPEMVNRHNIAAVIKKEQLTKGGGIKVIENTYRNTDSGIRPYCSLRKLENEEIYKCVVSRFDRYGNPLCVSKTGFPKTCYIWGYRASLPVAEIIGATYEEVLQAIGGQSVIDQIAGTEILTKEQVTLINGLRASLPQAMVTTYTYIPLIGVLSITDPSDRKVTYEYDDAGRLQKIRNGRQEIIKEYEYIINE